MNADPNQPATNAAVLLLRAETRSEFRGLRSEVGAGFARTEERFRLIDERFSQMDERFARVDERFAQIDQRFNRVDDRLIIIERSMELIAQQTLEILNRS